MHGMGSWLWSLMWLSYFFDVIDGCLYNQAQVDVRSTSVGNECMNCIKIGVLYTEGSTAFNRKSTKIVICNQDMSPSVRSCVCSWWEM